MSHAQSAIGMPGTSRVARTIAGTVVTSSSSMIRGFVSATYARTWSPTLVRRVGACRVLGGVLARGRRTGAGRARRPAAPSGPRSTRRRRARRRRPRGAPRARRGASASTARGCVATCSAPTMTWTTYVARIATASQARRGCAARLRQAAHATAARIARTTAATYRCRACAPYSAARSARGRIVDDRHERAVHERPVGEDEAGVARRDVRAEEQDGERRRGPERGEEREPLAAAPGEPGRVRRPDEEVDEQPDERHRGREMRRHGLAGVPEPDRLAPEPRLEADEEHRRQRRPAGSTADRDGPRRRAPPCPGSAGR